MWEIGGEELASRLLIGSARYVSQEVMCEAIRASEAEVVTVSLRRLSAGNRQESEGLHAFIRQEGLRVLPNTAGCHTVKEAVTTAHMARELFGTNWIKLEVLSRDQSLCPDVFGTVEAAGILAEDGFEVFPYTTDDLVVAERLLHAGCRILMPWAAPIGSGQGVRNPSALAMLRQRLPEAVLIVDAGLGRPSHAAQVMEMGYDGVLLNTAVASAGDAMRMAAAFARAVEAGRMAWESGFMPVRDAQASSPVEGTPFRKAAGI